jgi:hypothetical protein
LISGADIHEGGVIAKDFGDTMVFDEISQTFMNEANLRTGRAIFPLNKKTWHTIVLRNSAYWIVGEVSSQRPTIGRLILNQLFQDAYVLCAPYSHPVQHRWCFRMDRLTRDSSSAFRFHAALRARQRARFGSLRHSARQPAPGSFSGANADIARMRRLAACPTAVTAATTFRPLFFLVPRARDLSLPSSGCRVGVPLQTVPERFNQPGNHHVALGHHR